jgi:hypothetical protein
MKIREHPSNNMIPRAPNFIKGRTFTTPIKQDINTSKDRRDISSTKQLHLKIYPISNLVVSKVSSTTLRNLGDEILLRREDL